MPAAWVSPWKTTAAACPKPCCDDGAAAGGGLGLVGIEERVRELGGAVALHSQPGKGTLMKVSIPLPGASRMKKTRILLADDHGVVRKGLRFLLESEPDLEVVGEAADGRQARGPGRRARARRRRHGHRHAAAQRHRCHRRRSCAAHPQTGVIILSMHSDEAYLVRALTAGAKGYLLKDSAEDDLVRAIRSVSEGKPFFSPAIAKTLLEDYVRHLQQRGLTDSYDLLTDREKEVLQLLAEGKTNKEVATLLDLSPYTVETHRNRIMQKLNLHNTAEIVLYAVRKKIIA